MSEVLLKERVYEALASALGALEPEDGEYEADLPFRVRKALNEVRSVLSDLNVAAWAPIDDE